MQRGQRAKNKVDLFLSFHPIIPFCCTSSDAQSPVAFHPSRNLDSLRSRLSPARRRRTPVHGSRPGSPLADANLLTCRPFERHRPCCPPDCAAAASLPAIMATRTSACLPAVFICGGLGSPGGRRHHSSSLSRRLHRRSARWKARVRSLRWRRTSHCGELPLPLHR